MHRRQVLVAIAEMVLAELAGRVTEALEHLGDGHVFGLDPQGGAGHANLGQARADRLLAREERRTASGAALLAIEIREHRALAGDAIHVRRPIAHDAVVVAAQIEPTDVVSHDEENIWFVASWPFTARLAMEDPDGRTPLWSRLPSRGPHARPCGDAGVVRPRHRCPRGQQPAGRRRSGPGTAASTLSAAARASPGAGKST